MADFVFPEDGGTNSLLGVNDGDFDDAANFASFIEATQTSDYVVRGLNLQNVSGGTFDLTTGKAFVSDSSATAGQSSESRDERVAYVVELDARTGLSYTTGDVNYVFVDVLLTDDDAVDIVINTTDTAPSEPSIKIAEIDDT